MLKTHRIIVTVKKQSPGYILFVYMSEVNLTVQSEPITMNVHLEHDRCPVILSRFIILKAFRNTTIEYASISHLNILLSFRVYFDICTGFA